MEAPRSCCIFHFWREAEFRFARSSVFKRTENAHILQTISHARLLSKSGLHEFPRKSINLRDLLIRQGKPHCLGVLLGLRCL